MNEQQVAQLEKRLKSFADTYFNAKNYKQTAKLCSKHLKKYPEHKWVKVYLAMAKLKLGQSEEALAVLEEAVEKHVFLYPRFLGGLLQPTCARCGRFDLATKAYEKAYKTNPKEEMYLEGLLSCYLNEERFQHAARHAGVMKKALSGHDDLFNLATAKCLQLQASKAQDDKTRTMRYNLAELTLNRLLGEGRLKDGEQVRFFCSVLAQQGKSKNAVQLLEGEVGRKAIPFEEHRLKLLCEYQEEGSEQLRRSCREILAISVDDWDAWSTLLRTATSEEHQRATLALIDSFEQQHPRSRGPPLARMEFLRRYPAVAQAEMRSLVLDYTERFGSKPCWWSDVAYFVVQGVQQEHYAALWDDLRKQVQPIDWEKPVEMLDAAQLMDQLRDANDADAEKRDGKDAGKLDLRAAAEKARQEQQMLLSNLYKLKRTLGLLSPSAQGVQQLLAFCGEIVSQYMTSCRLLRPHLEETEGGPTDGNVLIAAHALLDVFRSDASSRDTPEASRYVLAAAIILQQALLYTPFYFEAKLVLLELFYELGCFSLSLQMYRSLEVKHVQHETLAHFVMYPVLAGGDLEEVQRVANDAIEYREGTLSNSVPRSVQECFKHGKWSQVEDFLLFSARMKRSFNVHLAEVELALRGCTQEGEWTPEGAKSYLESRRAAALVSSGWGTRDWLGELLDALQRYEGKKEDMRLAYNCDQRVKVDFSAGQLKSREEWSAHEWTVPSSELEWGRSRALLLAALESSLTVCRDDKGAVEEASLQRLEVHFSQLQQAWQEGQLCGGASGDDALAARLLQQRDAKGWGNGVSYSLLHSAFCVTLNLAKLRAQKDDREQALDAAQKAAADLVKALVLQKQVVVGQEGSSLLERVLRPSWVKGVSHVAIEVLPILALQAQNWSRLSFSKAQRKKQKQPLRSALVQLSQSLNEALKHAQELLGAVGALEDEWSKMGTAALLEWNKEHVISLPAIGKIVAQQMEQAAETVTQDCAASWQAALANCSRIARGVAERLRELRI